MVTLTVTLTERDGAVGLKKDGGRVKAFAIFVVSTKIESSETFAQKMALIPPVGYDFLKRREGGRRLRQMKCETYPYAITMPGNIYDVCGEQRAQIIYKDNVELFMLKKAAAGGLYVCRAFMWRSSEREWIR